MLISTPTAQIIELILDISNQKYIDSRGFNIDRIELYVNSQVVFRLTCYDDFSNSIISNMKNLNLLWGFDSTFVAHHNDIINVLNFNDSDDWADVDPENGKICWRVDTSDANIMSYIGQEKSKIVYSDLWILGDGDPDEPDVLINADTILLKNISSRYLIAP